MSADLKQCLQRACARLHSAGIESARIDSEVLLADVLGKSRTWLYTHPEYRPDSQQSRAYEQLVAGRERGEPVAYLTGRQEFWSLPLMVNPAVLIPRPETELLVETALDYLKDQTEIRVADLGTGSGAIALAIASERPRAQVYATDISEAALDVARLNAEHLNLSVRFAQGHWAEALSGSFDVLLSNPPYVASDDPHLQQGDLRFEPGVALSAGDDELLAFRQITQQASARLKPGGWLLFEHGHQQGAAVRDIVQGKGFERIQTLNDLEQRERVSLGRLPTHR